LGIDEAIYGPFQGVDILTEAELSDTLNLSYLQTDIESALEEPNGMTKFMLSEMWKKIQATPKIGNEGGVMDMLTPTAFALLFNCSYRRDPISGNLLSPCTDAPEYAQKSQALWSDSVPKKMSQIVEMDIQQVGVDTGALPIDEYISFRNDNRSEHQRYMRAVRGFCEQIQNKNVESQEMLINQRKQEIADYGAELNKRTLKSLAQPSSLSVGFGGVCMEPWTWRPYWCLDRSIFNISWSSSK